MYADIAKITPPANAAPSSVVNERASRYAAKPFSASVAIVRMFCVTTMSNGASAVAPTKAGSAVCVLSVRSTPYGANRYDVQNGDTPVASAFRIHQKFQRNATLSPGGPGSADDMCAASGHVISTASPTNAAAGATTERSLIES